MASPCVHFKNPCRCAASAASCAVPAAAGGMAAQRAAAWPLPFGPYFACHSRRGKKKQAAHKALPAV